MVLGDVRINVEIHGSALKKEVRAIMDGTRKAIEVRVVAHDRRSRTPGIMVIHPEFNNGVYWLKPEEVPFYFVDFRDTQRLEELFALDVQAVRSSIEAAIAYREKYEAERHDSD